MITTAISFCAAFVHTYMHEICFGVTAVALTLFGPHINECLRRITKKLHWLIRYGAFVVLCTCGYTFLSQVAYNGLKNLLSSFTSLLLVIVTIVIYLVLAWIAKEQKVI